VGLTCAVDGVPVAANKAGRLVHLDAIPEGVDPDHEVTEEEPAAFRAREDARVTLRGAAEDMLAHHAALHPTHGCEWAVALEEALRMA